MRHKTHPVAVGNVVYLNGSPGQDVLKAVTDSMIKDPVALAKAEKQFLSIMEMHGKPLHRFTIDFGPGLKDLLAADGCVLAGSPWGQHCDGLIVVQAEGHEVAGYYAAPQEGILFRLPQNAYDLTALEVARALAERPDPDARLVKWFEDLQSDVPGIDCVPEELRAHVARDFCSGVRYFDILTDRDANGVSFWWTEGRRVFGPQHV